MQGFSDRFAGKVRAIVVASAAALLPAPLASAQITLTNATSSAGLTFTHQPDSVCIGFQTYMTAGLAVGDVNGDDLPDIFVVGGGLVADRLYLNDGDGTFTNAAVAWGLTALHGGNGASMADYDDDGDLDIYVTSFGLAGQPGQPGKHRLYKNNGSAFVEVAVAAGCNYTTLNSVATGYGSAWGDYDLDGDLDLCVVSWKDTLGLGNNGTGNRLFQNDGDGTFTDVTSTAIGTGFQGAWGFQAAFVDMDGDRYPEILLAADFQTSRYLRNNRDGTFTNFTVASGTGLDDNGMGQTVADFNNDGLLDWYVTSIFEDNPAKGDYTGNTLYMNQGDHSYLEVASAAGVSDGGWGWGTLAIDFDHDGWDDIVEINGREAVGGEWTNERGYLWRNNADDTFTEMGIEAGFDHVGSGRAMGYLDIEPDGDLDFVMTVNAQPILIYRNEAPAPDQGGGNWLQLAFDTSGNDLLPPNGFGTRVTLLAGKLQRSRYFSASPSYLATSEPILHFGLGPEAVIDEITIDWSRGYTTTLTNIAANQRLTISAPGVADFNADGTVGAADLAELLATWGDCTPGPLGPCLTDLNLDGSVNAADLGEVLANWG
jgi:hypothetical protein